MRTAVNNQALHSHKLSRLKVSRLVNMGASVQTGHFKKIVQFDTDYSPTKITKCVPDLHSSIYLFY